MLESTRLDSVPDAAGRGTQGAVGDRSGSAGGRLPSVGVVADPELIERPRRRRFAAEYKLKVVRQADACTRPGEIGALLRREGLYSSLLTEWRRARDSGALEALAPKRRGPRGPRLAGGELEALRRRLGRVEAELDTAPRGVAGEGKGSAPFGGLLGAQNAAPTPD